jgi:hypothetical protein
VRAAVLAVTVAGTLVAATPAAHADGKPDPNTDLEASEANLESSLPRTGVMFGIAGGLGVLIGGDIGVGRGGALSLRLGHVATRSTEITFEISGTGALHKLGMNDSPVTDTNAGLFAGALTYFSRATWVRVAAGPTVFTANVGGTGQHTAGGFGGLVGGGLDVARFGYLVLGFEAFGMTSVTSDGFKMQLGFAFGVTYY